jgi:hypothetical protein
MKYKVGQIINIDNGRVRYKVLPPRNPDHYLMWNYRLKREEEYHKSEVEDSRTEGYCSIKIEESENLNG